MDDNRKRPVFNKFNFSKINILRYFSRFLFFCVDKDNYKHDLHCHVFYISTEIKLHKVFADNDILYSCQNVQTFNKQYNYYEWVTFKKSKYSIFNFGCFLFPPLLYIRITIQ